MRTAPLTPQAQSLLRHLRRSALLPQGASCVLAISGGGDSVALARLLCELRSTLNMRLYAAHLNHSLRPEADDDAHFVAELCATLDIPLLSECAEVATFAQQHHLSLEEAGRQLRYDLFERALSKFGATYLLTAHTASDQAETVLMRLIAGTGLNGLGGVRPSRALGNATIVRPLLIFQGQELRDYLRTIKQPWCEDSTNHQPTAPRTRVRWQLLPLLEQWNPRIVENLCAFSDRVRADEELLEAQSLELIQAARLEGDAIAIPLDILRRSPASWRIRAYRHWLPQECSLQAVHYSAIEDKINNPSGENAHLDLPGDWEADIYKDALILHPHRLVSETLEPLPEVSWDLEAGLYRAERYNLIFDAEMVPVSQRPTPQCICIDPAKVKRLTLRTRRPGDTFFPAGGVGHTKLKKYFNALGLTAQQRDRQPLLCAEGEIVWIVGERADQRFLAKPNQQHVWRLTVRPLSE